MQPELFEFCRKNDIAVIAYAPVGSPGRWDKSKAELVLSQDPAVVQIAERVGKSPTQVGKSFLTDQRRMQLTAGDSVPAKYENF